MNRSTTERQKLNTVVRSLVGAFLVAGPLRAQSPPAAMMNHAPVWARTANLIVFDSDRGGHSAVYVLDPDEGTIRQVTRSGLVACCGRWTPDGAWILFEADSEGMQATYRVRPNGTDLARMTDSANEPGNAASDGTVAVVVVVDGESNLHLVSQGGTRTQLTSGSWASQPSFSPDGQHLVYEDRTGDDVAASKIVVIGRNGLDRRVLALGTDPSWSPDGSSVLFKTPTARVGGFGWEIATIHSDGTALRRLVAGVHPTWSPTGHRIAYMVETGPQRTDIWVMAANGTDQRCVTCAH